MIRADWTATDPVSGRFTGVYSVSALSELQNRFRELRAAGEGYFQVARVGAEYPYLMLGFCGNHAVLYCMNSEESMSVHDGDGSVARDESVAVLVMQEHSYVTGEIAIAVDLGWDLVEDFVRTGSTGDERDWSQL